MNSDSSVSQRTQLVVTESKVESGDSQKTQSSFSIRSAAVVVSWLLFAIYTLTMPFVSNWANNRWFNYPFYDGQLCDAPASAFTCTNGEDFAELAMKYRGEAVGCGCGQGYLGEGLCPLFQGGYTLSGFITTAPGVGALAAFSALPTTAMWYYQDAMHAFFKPEPCLKTLNMLSLSMFQVTYGWFLIASACTFPWAHGTSTYSYVLCMIVHMLTSAKIASSHAGTRTARIIIVCVVFGLGVMIVGFLPAIFTSMNRGFGSYMFWLGESLSLTTVFGIVPLVMMFGDIDEYAVLHLDRNLYRALDMNSDVVPTQCAQEGKIARDINVV
jgi:hypothetical protein